MSLELLVQHPVYKHLLRFSGSVEAREKVLRLLQYLVRLLRFWRFKALFSGGLSQLLPALQSTLTLLRKPLRCLKPLNHLNAFSLCISNELSDPVLRYSEALKQLGFFFFFSLDSIQLMKMMGLLGGRGVNDRLTKNRFVKNISKYAGGMWCLALVGGLIKNLRQFQILLARYSNKDIEEDQADRDRKLNQPPMMSSKKIQRDFVKNVLDFVIAINMYRELNIDNGIIGAFGVLTSAIGIQDLWSATK